MTPSHLVAFYDTLGILRTYFRLKPRRPHGVTIGEKSNKVIDCQHISKNANPVLQRHAIIGTKQMYARLQELVVPVRTHTHDRNKYVRDEHLYTVNDNDTWHGEKMKKLLAKLVSGPKYLIGKTWSESYQDKYK